MFKITNVRGVDIAGVRGFEFTMVGQWSDVRCCTAGVMSREEGLSIIKDALEVFVRELPVRGEWRTETFDGENVCYEAHLREEGDKTYPVNIDGRVVSVEDATHHNKIIVDLW